MMIDFKHTFAELEQKNLKEEDISLLESFLVSCEKFGEFNYYFKAVIMLTDLYLDLNNLNKALDTINLNFNKPQLKKDELLLLSTLDRIIFIYLEKRNFSVAYKYASIKRQYIKDTDYEDINRWNLEMATIYSELGQKSKARSSLLAIIQNSNSKKYYIIALSNLTRLYLDEKMLDDAKKILNLTLNLKLNEEDQKYISYLFAKLANLEGNKEEAKEYYKQSLASGINIDNAETAIDYLDFLISNKDLKEAERVNSLVSKVVYEHDNYFYKKHLSILQVKLGSLKVKNQELLLAVTQLELRDKEFYDRQNQILLDTLEEERETNEASTLDSQTEMLNKLEKKLGLVYLTAQSLNDVLLSFGKLLYHEGIKVDFTLFLFLSVFPFSLTKSMISYAFKENRLYEKTYKEEELDESLLRKLKEPQIQEETVLGFDTSVVTGLKLTSEEKILIKRKLDHNSVIMAFLIKGMEENTSFNQTIVKLLFSSLENYVDSFFKNQSLTILNELRENTRPWYLIFDEFIYQSESFKMVTGIKDNLISKLKFLDTFSKNDLLKQTVEMVYNKTKYTEIRKPLLTSFMPVYLSTVYPKVLKKLTKDEFLKSFPEGVYLIVTRPDNELAKVSIIDNIYTEKDFVYTYVDSSTFKYLSLNYKNFTAVKYPEEVMNKEIIIPFLDYLFKRGIKGFQRVALEEFLKEQNKL